MGYITRICTNPCIARMKLLPLLHLRKRTRTWLRCQAEIVPTRPRGSPNGSNLVVSGRSKGHSLFFSSGENLFTYSLWIFGAYNLFIPIDAKITRSRCTWIEIFVLQVVGIAFGLSLLLSPMI